VSTTSRAGPLRVAHIVSALVIGGVEMGIVKSFEPVRRYMDYRVYYMKKPGTLQLGQKPALRLLLDLALKRTAVDVVVTSLWMAHPVGWISRLFGAKWVPFFHSAGIVHGVEGAVFSFAWRHSDLRLVDSAETGAFMSARYGSRAHRVVNYVFPVDEEPLPWGKREIDVIFVGRTDPVKRLDLIADLIEAYAGERERFRAVFVVSGGIPESLERLTRSFPGSVEVFSDVPNREVQRWLTRSRFYVMLSDTEGFSMSTAEAVLAGVVPVVRPVGEVGRYVSPECGLRVLDLSKEGLAAVARDMSRLMAREGEAAGMARRGRERMLEMYRPYVESFVAHVSEAAGQK
jgi:glycosyltransferase involved in cell wall biosynthesis